MIERRPMRHQVRVRDQHARRVRVGAKYADRLSRLHAQRLVRLERGECRDDAIEAFPVARGAADAAIHHELVGLLGHLRIEIVHEHPQRRLGQPALGRQIRAARRPDHACIVETGGHRNPLRGMGFGHALDPSRLGSSTPAVAGERAGTHEIGGGGDIRREIAVALEPRHAFAQARAHALERRAGRHRRMEVAALRRRDQLDRDDIRGILRHGGEPARAVRGHRHVVLLVGGGRNRVDAGRIRALLVLGDQRRGRHLRHHESGIETRLRRQKRRQPRQRGIDQHGDAPLGERADLAGRDRQDVGGKRHRLGMEVAAGQRLAAVGEDQRIVGDPVRLRHQRRRCVPQQIQHGAHHLRLATQAIRVLNAIIIDEVGRADRAACHQRAQRSGDLDLPAVAAQGVNARIERRIGALGGVGRQRARHQRGVEHAFDGEQARQRLRRRELGAVEQREPLFRAQHDRREPGAGQRRIGRHGFAGKLHFADAQHRRRHVRERGEIARRPDRALARYHRDHIARQHGFEHFDGLQPHPGGAAAEAGELQRHHQPHGRRSHRLADAGRVRQHDVALERGEVFGGDAHAGKPPEAGVDPVDRLTPGDDGLDRPRARFDRRHRGGIEPHGRALRHGAPVGERRASRRQRDRGGHLPLPHHLARPRCAHHAWPLERRLRADRLSMIDMSMIDD